jgi:hypothetical protein
MDSFGAQNLATNGTRIPYAQKAHRKNLSLILHPDDQGILIIKVMEKIPAPKLN